MIRAEYQGRGIPPCKRSLCELPPHVDFAAVGKDAIAVVSSLYSICGGTQVKDDGLPGQRVAHVKNHHFPCGCSSYQSKGFSNLDVFDL